MPTVQDEEESLCLLASDLQDLPMASAAASSSTEPAKINPEDEDWGDEKSSFLGINPICPQRNPHFFAYLYYRSR